jgi:hypothetical protein
MHKVNTLRIAEFTWSSPEGELIGAGIEISEELGRKPDLTDLSERHPFDVEICRIPPGKIALHLPFPQRAVGVLSRDFGQRRRSPQGRNHAD